MKIINLRDMTKCKTGVILLLIIFAIPSFSQSQEKLSESEKRYYNTIKELTKYLKYHDTIININDPMIQKYILFDYVLNDTSKERMNARIPKINSFLGGLKHYIDSIDLAEFDAKPVRFYRNDSNYYRPFNENLGDAAPLSFAYFDKRKPNHPYGYLLFDEKTGKLVSWIMINQGGYYYYLIFNLI